jgi:hypothetical protein
MRNLGSEDGIMKFPRLVWFLGVSLAFVAAGSGPAGASTAPPAADSAPRETPVERRVAPRKARAENSDQAVTAQPAPDPSMVDPVILERQIHTRFTLLNGCPAEVARHQRIAPAALKARRLTLRWTILPNGRVADTAVVATSPVDGRVMDCVKRQMSLWSFTQPLGGSVHLERPFTFQPQTRR